MLSNVLVSIIRSTFLTEIGKFQTKLATEKAMRIVLNTRIDYEKEEGYRSVEVLIFAPANYVQVWVRTHWNVISVDDLDYDEESDENFIKPGCDYDRGCSDLQLISDHDSGWVSGIEDVLAGKFGEVIGIENVGPSGKHGASRWFGDIVVNEFFGLKSLDFHGKIRSVVERNSSLCMDDDRDREQLINDLVDALGGSE